jgi:glycerate dehydrogenase
MFTRLDFPSVELYGKKLGIIGYGSIGRSVAEMARGFGMEV